MKSGGRALSAVVLDLDFKVISCPSSLLLMILQFIKLTSSAPVRLWCAKAADSDSLVVYVLSWEVLSALRDH